MDANPQAEHNAGIGFARSETSSAEVDAIEARFVPLASALRELVDATIRSEVDDAEAAAALAEIESATRRLRASQVPGAAGVRYNRAGRVWSWGNSVVGLRNAIAPPLEIHHEPDGLVWAEVDLGAAYEGPPGAVHGGVSALLLDQIMGETASGHRRPTVTGTLTLRYVRFTPLGKLRLEGRIEGYEGFKTFVAAHVADAEGPTVTARGVFILPGWARERFPMPN